LIKAGGGGNKPKARQQLTSEFHFCEGVKRIKFCVIFADSLTFEALKSAEKERTIMKKNEYQKKTLSKAILPFTLCAWVEELIRQTSDTITA
jgi:hypothetical protein